MHVPSIAREMFALPLANDIDSIRSKTIGSLRSRSKTLCVNIVVGLGYLMSLWFNKEIFFSLALQHVTFIINAHTVDDKSDVSTFLRRQHIFFLVVTRLSLGRGQLAYWMEEEQ